MKINKTIVKKSAKRNKHDSGWKKIIRLLFKAFMEYFFIDIHNAIDFSKKITFLDKELNEIDPGSSLGDRMADVLVKVHLNKESGGRTQYICIVAHIEVQGQPELTFMDRMFIYFYRAFDKEKRKKVQVISLALLTDDDPKFRPTDYGYELFGFKLFMQIPTAKLLDFKYNPALIAKQETSDNPMALVVKAQLKSMELKGANAARKFEALKELIRLCYQKKYSQEYTRIILKFFALIIRVPDAYKKKISQVIINSEEELKMEYVPLWERDALNQGIKLGVERGVKRGVKQGVKQGVKEGIVQVAINMIKKGMDILQISELTGLTKEEIEKLYPTTH